MAERHAGFCDAMAGISTGIEPFYASRAWYRACPVALKFQPTSSGDSFPDVASRCPLAVPAGIVVIVMIQAPGRRGPGTNQREHATCCDIPCHGRSLFIQNRDNTSCIRPFPTLGCGQMFSGSFEYVAVDRCTTGSARRAVADMARKCIPASSSGMAENTGTIFIIL